MKSKKGKKKAKCTLYNERLAAQVAQDQKAVKMRVKKAMDKGKPLSEEFTNEWKTKMAARREQLEQLTNPPKKQKVERLFVDEVDDLIFDYQCVTMSTRDNTVRNARDYSNSAMCMNVIT